MDKSMIFIFVPLLFLVFPANSGGENQQGLKKGDSNEKHHLHREKRDCSRGGLEGFLNNCGEPPSGISISPDNYIRAEVGQHITRRCNATSPADYTVEWTKDSVVVSRSSLLDIPSVQPRHAGLFTCTAINRNGRLNATLTIKVSCGGNFTSESGELTFPGKLDDASKCNYTIAVPPGNVITVSFIDDSGWDDIGYFINIYDGNSKRSKTLVQYIFLSTAHHTSSGNTLFIEYSRDHVGRSDIVASYNTEFPPAVSPVSELYNVRHGESVILKCNFTSNLPIITALWQQQLENNIRNVTAEVDSVGGTISLNISNAEQKDGGKYRCLVSNKAGISRSDNITLLIQDVNECENVTLNTCQHDCVNTFGSYDCRCWRGYIEDNDGICRLDSMNIDKYLKTLVITVSIEGPYEWNDSLQDSQSPYYKTLESQFIETVNEILKKYSGYRETLLLSLRPGSIVADFTIIMDLSSNASILLQTLQEHVTLQTFGSFQVKNETISSRTGDGYIYELDIEKNFTVHEGTTLKVPCVANAISITGNVDFEWKLNGSTIRPSATSRIQITYKKVDNTHYKSTLIIRDIQQNYAGIIQCAAVLGEVVNRTSQIDVYRFTIRSTSFTLRSGSNATVNCTIHPPTELAKNALKMCKDGKIVSDSLLTYQRHVAILKLDKIINSISIGCGWNNETGCSKTINIDVFSPTIEPCKLEYDHDSITWSETVPGKTNYQPCPSGFKGLASRQCHLKNYVGQWAKSSFVNCTREVFVSISEQLQWIQSGVAVDEMVNILRTFSNETADIIKSDASTAGDIRVGVEILAKASEIVTDRTKITTEERQEIFTATDTMLEAEAEEIWGKLNEETGENYAAKVMDVVSNVSRTVLKSLPKNESVNKVMANMVLQIKHTPVGQITFPDSDVMNETTNFKSLVNLSKETIYNSLEVNDSVAYSAVYYKTISQLFPEIKSSSQKTIGSPVVAFSIPKDIIKRQLDPPIQLFLETFETNLTNRECSYWNFDLPNGGNWATDGCEIYSDGENLTECRCNHLTNFAVLLSLQEISKTDHQILSTLSMVGCIISIIGVVLTLIVYTVEWKNLSSDKSVILVLMCIVILISYTTFLVGIEKTENKDVCTAVAVSLHFLFLTILFLMAAEGIIHAVLVISVFPQRRSINRILLPLVFGLPTVIVVTSGIVTKLDGYGTDKLCWISTENKLIYAFYGPCLAVVLMNFVITGLVLRKLFSTRATMSKTRREKLKTGIRSIIILAPVFGLTWIFGLLSFNEDMIIFSYLFVVCNSLQGLLIFVLHGIMNENVKKSVKKRASRIMKRQDYITTTKSTESTNTWNVFKKMKPKTNRKPSDVTDSSIGPSALINPIYSGVTTNDSEM